MKTPASRGFTLVEVLVVMVIMGIVVTSIYSLYESTQRTASTEERVVEVQQNLRVAMDQLARDIRMAGFLIPTDLTPVAQAPVSPLPGTPLELRTASATGYVARVSGAASFANSDQADFTVADSGMVDIFESGLDGHYVRVIRPPDRSQPADKVFQIVSKHRGTRRLTLKASSSVTADYVPGDLIVRTEKDALHPMTISYTLDQDTRILRRKVNDNADEVASDILTCTLSYIMKDGTELDTTVLPESLGEIRAIRVTLGGSASNPGGEEKLRTLTSVIPVKNP